MVEFSADGSGFGAEERAALRDSVRGLLRQTWPAGGGWVDAREDGSGSSQAYRTLAEHGFLQLGAAPDAGGLQEIVLVMEELGRASCPASVIGAYLLNLLSRHSGIAFDPVAGEVLREIHKGQVAVAASFGVLDGSATGPIASRGNRITGTAAAVEVAGHATHLAIATGRSQLALVRLDADGVRVEQVPVYDRPGFAHVAFTDAECVQLDVGGRGVEDLLLIARLAVSGRALGSASRALELAVDYARMREQFGQPIGKFQAIQHKLANCFITLQAAGLSIYNAAAQFDGSSDVWRALGAAASAYASASLRRVALEVHHTFGAIGYSEEHEAPRHFRRIHLDALLFGGAGYERSLLADYFLEARDPRFPDYDLTAEAAAFRQEVREWLGMHWSGERKASHDALPFKDRIFNKELALEVGQAGWNGLIWPERFGGMGRGAHEQLILLEEFGRVDAPRLGAQVQAVQLMLHGTPEQQARYLPEILEGRASWGIGYSEPNSGSDLASLVTRAERDGDEWVLNGEKIWTTTYWGEYMLVAARTDPSAKSRRRGISVFIVPTDTPGLTFRPSETLYSGTFANVLYDDVRLPADALLGAENDGWTVLTSALATERSIVGGGIVVPVVRGFERFCKYLGQADLNGRPAKDDPIVRDVVSRLASEIEAARQMMLHCARLAEENGGAAPAGDASASKVFSGELMERFAEAVSELLGMPGTISQGGVGAVLDGRFEQMLRHSLMYVISLGTNEIQRNIIAQNSLGLPR